MTTYERLVLRALVLIIRKIFTKPPELFAPSDWVRDAEKELGV